MVEGEAVSEVRERERDAFEAFFAAVGESVLAQSVVGRPPLRDVWALRFLGGFQWNSKVCMCVCCVCACVCLPLSLALSLSLSLSLSLFVCVCVCACVCACVRSFQS